MSGNGYTWVGADGGSWTAESNWEDAPGTNDTGRAPGSLDIAQFLAFSGTVTGAPAAQLLYVGPDSDLTLGGSGFFSMITIGQDAGGIVGLATLEIGGGNVISTTLLELGTPLGGTGALVVNGTFTTTGASNIGNPELPGSVTVGSAGEFENSSSQMTMFDGGTLALSPSGMAILGSGGGVAGALVIEAGRQFFGTGTITGNVVVNGALRTDNFGDPATRLAVSGSVTGSGSLNVNLELDIGGSIGSGVTADLFGGVLRLADGRSDAGTLDTLATGSTIALSGLDFDQVAWSPDALTVTGASGTLALATIGDHSHQSFITAADPLSGTDIIVACFVGGTRILTARGEAPVEALRPGVFLPASLGALEPITWIGRRRIDCYRHSPPEAVWPVRVAAGAFGPGLPARPLLLSPDHAVFIADTLIPIRHLVNGVTIVQERWDEVVYWHLELPRHGVLLAEGLPVESFLDTGNRSAFEGGANLVARALPTPRSPAPRRAPCAAAAPTPRSPPP